ncbi:hypothetical protein DDZ14_12875 [Maritimibacter sp. 55A14]|uniref:hypothetical protein n=1 Tax=Maritimibacter sp. 55A14 TaxID=2174844 RepID=UPI000D60FF97|nr:hypothetical protein [Maritimibacter sp. 55A14]PWE31401.1 hypothetical protein DDZ14_12875 [Maritimibacter sp. 55A14]
MAINTAGAGRQADGTARPGSAGDGFDEMSPERAACLILDGVARRCPMIPVGRVARLAWWLNRLSPLLYERLRARRIL